MAFNAGSSLPTISPAASMCLALGKVSFYD
jgi:hypothetical protein